MKERKGFFYGWVILPAAILGTLASIPGQTVGVSVFTDFLLEVHSVSRNGISLAYLVGTVGSALLLSWAGRLYDRFGARRMGVPVALSLSLTLLLLSFSDHIATLLSSFFLFSAGSASFIVLVLCFFMVRFFGQGNLTMISRNMVMKWFDRRRGLANAFLGVAISLGFSAAPGLIDSLIRSAGWRESWRLMALALLGMALLILLLYRDKPSDVGQFPDGNLIKKSSIPGNDEEKKDSEGGGKDRKRFFPRLPIIASLPAEDFTLKEARRTPVFWLVALSISMASLLVTAATFHVVSIFEEAGISRAKAVILFLPGSIVAVVFQFIGSSISDYIKERWLAIAQMIGGLLLAATVIVSGDFWMQLLFVIGIGLCQGMMGINSAIIWPRLFGLSHLGAIGGFAIALGVAGSAIGPFAFSLSLDIFGSYRGGGIVFVAIELGLILFAVIKKDFHPYKNRESRG
jgi:MFS transporter, OFA family, oxalate/formate antiporter